MQKIQSELKRLNFFPRHQDSAKEDVQTIVIGFDRSSDWPQVSNLYHYLQNDLAFPAPAVAVSGLSGYQVLIPFEKRVPDDEAQEFLQLLQEKYFPDIPAANLMLYPNVQAVETVPAVNSTTGRWSAFIDPDMGAMFIEESGLEMAPNFDRQAEMLARIKSINPAVFQDALNVLRGPNEIAKKAVSSVNPAPKRNDHDNNSPQRFLLAVMNDVTMDISHRIEAAKALLPYSN